MGKVRQCNRAKDSDCSARASQGQCSLGPAQSRILHGKVDDSPGPAVRPLVPHMRLLHKEHLPLQLLLKAMSVNDGMLQFPDRGTLSPL